MIQEFITKFDQHREELLEQFKKEHPGGYLDIVKAVVEAISGDDDYDVPDPERIHSIDDGDYQGTLLFVIAAKGYQPSTYWAVKVDYGSCSGCDTFESIRSGGDYYSDAPSEEQAKQYMTLAIHLLQGLKEI